MGRFDLINRIRINNPYSNLDIYYGPYNGLNDALSKVPIEIRDIGLTVGIIQNGYLVEYWWRNGKTDSDLVRKGGYEDNTVPVYNAMINIPPSGNTTTPDEVLFIDEGTPILSPDEDRQILIDAIYALQNEVALIKRSFTDHMDCGSLANDKIIIEGGSTDIVADEPLWASETGVPLDVSAAPETPDLQPQDPNILKITHLTIKSGKSSELQPIIGYLLPDEMIWVYDTKRMYIKMRDGSLLWLNSGSGSGEIITGATSGGTNNDIIIDMDNLKSITFVSPNDTKYLVSVNNEGVLGIINQSVETPPDSSKILTTGVYSGFTNTLYLPKLYINSLYCGGLDSELPQPEKYQYCSHNFVELSNLNDRDISLNNLSLKYSINGATWETLRLQGIIKAQSTFLIRGAQCSIIEANTTIIKVNTYDMEWVDSNNKLISFSNIKSKFLLMYEGTGTTVSAPIAKPYIQSNATTAYCIPGYIDMVGINIPNSTEATSIDGYENAPFKQLVASNRLYMKYFQMDPVKQATKGIGERNNSSDWTWIELSKNLQPNIELYSPKSSFENKNIFFDKTKLNSVKPNMITVTFGRNAHTTRCFNWVSVGYYDEFLSYRISGSTNWTVIESFKPTDNRTTYTNKYYNRIRVRATDSTSYTAHKMIISGLTPGIYEYKCGRVGYESDIQLFKVVAESTGDFSFVQTTDQQGFNWPEYQVWQKAANFIKDAENPTFTLNTGDMTQNGNRINEWIDYYNAGKSLFDGSNTSGNTLFNGVEQMNVIGNNDLCPANFETLGDGNDFSKINAVNMLFFYTYEMDESNLPILTISGNTYLIPSLYSFDYNDVHFLMVNSEISEDTENLLFAGADLYSFIKTWCQNDIDKTSKKWKIAACHEMPFTIITDALITSYLADNNVVRGGSRINTTVKTGEPYWFSRFMEQNNIRLCLGGHKHTYSQSYPIKENVSGSTIYSMKPKIQVLDSVYNFTDISGNTPYKTIYNNKTATGLCELEIVPKITAPIYVMCQSTGYKQTSNKELPAVNIPWLENYFPSSIVDGTPTANSGQKYPFYIRWSITSNQIIGHVVKINNIMTSGKFNINTPNTNAIVPLNGNGTSNKDIIIDL